MKTRMTKEWTISPLVGALLLAMGAAGAVHAASTGSTASVQGSVPVLSAPSNGAAQAVDFSGTFAVPGQLSTGDTLVMTYRYQDADGDEDSTHTTVTWSYTPAGGGADQLIPATNQPASASGGQGTSTITIPAAALGAPAIKVTVQELSATGDPISGHTLTVTDTSLSSGPGSGGGTTTPPGPVMPGGTITGGIFLQSDAPTAGSAATDYARASSVHPLVGKTYVFRAWNDANGNGAWDTGEADLTATLSRIQWQLDGANVTANGNSPVVTLSNQSITGATTDTYTVPDNATSHSGAVPGDQGFSLRVSFN